MQGEQGVGFPRRTWDFTVEGSWVRVYASTVELCYGLSVSGRGCRGGESSINTTTTMRVNQEFSK